MDEALLDEVEIKPLFVDGVGGAPLALYPFLPGFEPEKVLVLYHDAGTMHSQESVALARHLVEDHHIAVYLVELRAHGLSAGAKEPLKDPKWLLEDIDLLLLEVEKLHPGRWIYLGAHGLTCALLAHFATRTDHLEKIKSLIFLAPYFGPFTTLYDFLLHPMRSRSWPFAKVHLYNLALSALSKGVYAKEAPGFTLSLHPLPEEKKGKHHAQRSLRLHPTFDTQWAYYFHSLEPQSLLAQIHKPLHVFLPKEDLVSSATTRSFFAKKEKGLHLHEGIGEDRFDLLLHAAKPLAHDLALGVLEQ